ncbi:hypothetical protein ACJX0J_011571, partial [Zea mays]
EGNQYENMSLVTRPHGTTIRASSAPSSSPTSRLSLCSMPNPLSYAMGARSECSCTRPEQHLRL